MKSQHHRVGYVRVSTREQHLDLQLDALRQAGCQKIFRDVISGAKADRPGLQAALEYLRPNDGLEESARSAQPAGGVAKLLALRAAPDRDFPMAEPNPMTKSKQPRADLGKLRGPGRIGCRATWPLRGGSSSAVAPAELTISL